MKWLKDIKGRDIRLSDERQKHIEDDHPEMVGQIDKIKETLLRPDVMVGSKADLNVEMFYKYYKSTPVTEKFLCVIVKNLIEDLFIITVYFTDTVKKGEVLWKKK
jgi:hypothetical protein